VLAICGVTTWALNPYALVLLLPALHGWLLLANGDGRARRLVAIPVLLAGLLPAAVLVWYYAGALELSVGDTAWAAWLAVAGGHVSPLAVLGTAAMLGCGLATLSVLRARDRAGVPPPGQPLKTRGPLTYAGPGSLGGTTSALRQ
jgi:hypothetical protein